MPPGYVCLRGVVGRPTAAGGGPSRWSRAGVSSRPAGVVYVPQAVHVISINPLSPIDVYRLH